MEGLAARLAAERLEADDELEPLRATAAELDLVVHGEIDLPRYTTLNERFHDCLVELAKSDTVARHVARVLALPFAAPRALLASYAYLPEAREILLVAQHQHRALIDALAAHQGTRAEEIAREHARLARQNLDLVLERQDVLERLPGAPLLEARERPPAAMPDESLQEAIERAGSPVSVLRDAQAPPTIFPVTPEFSNWRSEQRAWRETCALLDQSHHMTDLFLQGPDALRLLSDLGVNSFASFDVDRAKQFVAVNEDGFLIGDAILFHLGADSFDLVGWRMVIDWVRFHLETGDYDASAELDENSLLRAGPPRLFRFELQGPTALQLVERLLGGPVPEIAFFGMSRFTIAGTEVRALRHGMAGQPGFELFGPWDDGERVRQAILAAGQEFGLVRAGARAYSTANLESGWVPSPCPAIFTGGALEPYRRWLPVDRAGSLGGSLCLGRHRRLLPDAVRPRLRPHRRLRPRLRRPRRARADRRRPAADAR